MWYRSWGQVTRCPNLSVMAQRYLDRLGVLHDLAYRKANAGALRMEWPRIPLPGWPDGDVPGVAEELTASAELGRELAALLDSETPVPGVTTGALRPEIAAIAVPSTTDGGNMAGDDFSVTASWGHFGPGEAVMPGHGRAVERPYTAEERAALGNAAGTLGSTTFDIYLNDRAYWRNVPSAVWSYKLGGYQVLKKWLSYRERGVLGRPLLPEEAQHFTDTARRIADAGIEGGGEFERRFDSLPAGPAPASVLFDAPAHFVVEGLGRRDVAPRLRRRLDQGFGMMALARPGAPQDQIEVVHRYRAPCLSIVLDNRFRPLVCGFIGRVGHAGCSGR